MAKAIDFGSYVTVTTELFDALNYAGFLRPLTSELPRNYYEQLHLLAAGDRSRGFTAWQTYGVVNPKNTNITVWLVEHT